MVNYRMEQKKKREESKEARKATSTVNLPAPITFTLQIPPTNPGTSVVVTLPPSFLSSLSGTPIDSPSQASNISIDCPSNVTCCSPSTSVTPVASSTPIPSVSTEVTTPTKRSTLPLQQKKRQYVYNLKTKVNRPNFTIKVLSVSITLMT